MAPATSLPAQTPRRSGRGSGTRGEANCPVAGECSQVTLLMHDLSTIRYGLMYKPVATWICIGMEAAGLVLITVFGYVSLRYSIAEDGLWERTFFHANPGLSGRTSNLRWSKFLRVDPQPSPQAQSARTERMQERRM